MQRSERPLARTAFLVLVLFTLLAGDAWRYTIGWAGFGILAGLLAAASIALLIVHRGRWRLGNLPYPLLVFLLLATVSVTWSFYPAATALGLAATWTTAIAAVATAVTYSRAEIIRCLSLALRFVLGMSLLFELVVAAVIRQPVLPPIAQPGIDYATLDKVPPMLYWSRAELFEVLDGGRIQGIVGNATLLSFVALLGIIVFGIQLADGLVRKRSGVAWLLVAIAAFAFSRSATNIVGLIAVVLVLCAVLLVRRATTSRAIGVTYASLLAIVVAGCAGVLLFWRQILGLLGKGEDLTNRTKIWTDVIELANERPIIGWGWISHWVPWVSPFDTLAFNNGVRQLHAHNAWLDVWLQLGILGLVVFGALVLSTFVRAWLTAVDLPRPAADRRHTAVSLLPLLVLVALLVQSFAESRLLVEIGLYLLVLISVVTTFGDRRAEVS